MKLTTHLRRFSPTEASLDQVSDSYASRQELLVQWSAAAGPELRASTHERLGTEVLSTLHTEAMKANGEGVLEVVVERSGKSNLETLKNCFQKQPEVIFSEINNEVKLQYTSNDPQLASQWAIQSGFGSNAVAAWDRNIIGSSKIVTGLVDTGIDYTHKDLYLNIWLNQGEVRSLSFYGSLIDTDSDGLITFRDLNSTLNRSNISANLNDWNLNGYIDAGDLLYNGSGWEDGRDGDGNGYIDDLIGWDFANNDNDPYDDNGHGTHVAGIIGAVGGNGEGVSGINWNTQMAALKFLSGTGSGSITNAILAVDYFTTAAAQASTRAESTRFVGTNNSWGGGGFSQALANSIERANSQGLLFIAAAGNGGADLLSDNNDLTPNYPSNYTNTNVIAVASITSTGSLSSFSNYGAISVDLGAGGSSILSTLPGNSYGTLSGTSMATPQVTGALALMASVAPQATAQQLKNALLQSSAATPSLAGKTLSGGRLDVNAAVNAISSNAPTPTPTPSPATPPTNLVLWGSAANDVITGGSGNDRLTGVSSSGNTPAALGQKQVDKLTGGSGQDVFVLGDSRGVFYNDYNNANSGSTDYALITDFNANEDKLQLLSGSYIATASQGNLMLYWNRNNNNTLDLSGNNQDELIAKLQGITSLSSSNINWV